MVSLDGASRIAEGDEVEIYVDASRMHLFDPMTGDYVRSICPTPAASAVARPPAVAKASLSADDARLAGTGGSGRVSVRLDERPD